MRESTAADGFQMRRGNTATARSQAASKSSTTGEPQKRADTRAEKTVPAP
jgi:hypothetical protein